MWAGKNSNSTENTSLSTSCAQTLKILNICPNPVSFTKKTGLILIVIISQPGDKMFLMKKTVSDL